jgi:hypothetical protein
MPSLTIRNIPPAVMTQIRRAAAAERRSVNAQVVHWLEQATRWRFASADLANLYRRIRASRKAIARRHGPGVDSASLVRRLREERAGPWG